MRPSAAPPRGRAEQATAQDRECPSTSPISRAAATGAGASAALPPCHEGELLEQVHVLLVLQEGAVQRRDKLAQIALAELLGADVLRQEELQPVAKLGG